MGKEIISLLDNAISHSCKKKKNSPNTMCIDMSYPIVPNCNGIHKERLKIGRGKYNKIM